MKGFTKHLNHYIPLISVLLAGFAGIFLFSYDVGFQMIVIISVAISYVAWGVIHHHIHKDLHLPIVLEYVLIAALGVLIVSMILIE